MTLNVRPSDYFKQEFFVLAPGFDLQLIDRSADSKTEGLSDIERLVHVKQTYDAHLSTLGIPSFVRMKLTIATNPEGAKQLDIEAVCKAIAVVLKEAVKPNVKVTSVAHTS